MNSSGEIDKIAIPTTNTNQLNIPSAYVKDNGLREIGASTNNKQNKQEWWDLRASNRKLINMLSTQSDPQKFANWTGLEKSNDDSSLMYITGSDYAIDRLYTVDDVAMNSSGIQFAKQNLDKVREETRSLRNALASYNSNAERLGIKSTGKSITMLDSNGVTHVYEVCKVYAEKKGTNKYSQRQYPLGDVIDKEHSGIVLYDRGVRTMENPNYGINGNGIANLYLDGNGDADVRLRGNVDVGHSLHQGAPKLNLTGAFPIIK